MENSNKDLPVTNTLRLWQFNDKTPFFAQKFDLSGICLKTASIVKKACALSRSGVK
ncbi:hypothetical protein N643_05355 [Salmonella bongori serovar 48:z41:-- str. RKS3044]|nr:hypothetical protein N643_05355 [Salmonella bongori serovar 48:z41:-- str. RKS3044]